MTEEPQHLQLAIWCWVVQMATGESEECVGAWANVVSSGHTAAVATYDAILWHRVAVALSKNTAPE